MKIFKLACRIITALFIVAVISMPAAAYESAGSTSSATAQKTSQVLIKNVNIFDGKNEKLTEGMSVLIEGNKIAEIARSISAPDGAKVINAGGRTMTPGFIDMHYHIALASARIADVSGVYAPDLDFLGIVAAQEAERVLQRDFKSIRNAMGPDWGVKVAIDLGMVNGPRI